MILLCLALYACTSHFGYIKSYSVYIYTAFCILGFVPPLCLNVFFYSIEQLNCFCWRIESLFVNLYARTNSMLELIFGQLKFQHAQLENFSLMLIHTLHSRLFQ